MKAAAAGRARLLLTVALALWTAAGLRPPSRPEPAPAGAPPREFSAARAMAHVRAIAQRPHPLKSADHARVRTYIAGQFEELGTPAGLQIMPVTFRGDTIVLQNLVARLAGSGSTRPIMLAAHYDSTRHGPGAGDDAHGVAVLLETLRALRAGPPLRNDVIFLVTDGEEAGLLGASAFAKEHPWRQEPGVVLNFEARGTGGQATMFETSAGNEWLIRNLQAAAPWANATSFAYEVYRRMPNDTDLTVFKRAGLAGLNFAFIEHPEWYHHSQDDPEHLDLRSVQEQGDYALSLARQFGGVDLRRAASGDAVYFPTRLTGLIVYSGWWVLPLALMTVLALVLAVLVGWRRGKRGLWMGRLLAIPAGLLLFVARAAPGASYVLQWPLLGGVVALAVLMTAREEIGTGWRLAVLMVVPATSFLLIVPMLRTLVVALGASAGGMIAALAVGFVLVTVMPQLMVIARSGVGAPRKAG
uniref:Peptidase M28 n=1 Tax=Solibacter usitatus (strain Ellin6076) TaxID=234267 RepID=Q01VK7_SOLUE